MLSDHQLSLVCLYRSLVTGAPDDLLEAPETVDWRWLHGRLNWHRLSGLSAFYLRDSGCWEHIPESIKQSLLAAQERYRKNLESHKQLLQDFSKMVSDHGYTVIPVKGVALADTIYRDKPYRTMADIDVLIPPHHWKQLHAFLIEQGWNAPHQMFRNRWHHEILVAAGRAYPNTVITPQQRRLGRKAYSKGSRHVDVHWHPTYFLETGQPQWLDYEGFWARSEPAPEGAAFRCLQEKDQLLFLCLHAIEKHNPLLNQVLDIALLAKRVFGSWRGFCDRTEDWVPAYIQPRQKVIEFIHAVRELSDPEVIPGAWSPETQGVWDAFMQNEEGHKSYRQEVQEKLSPLVDLKPRAFSLKERLFLCLGYVIPAESLRGKKVIPTLIAHWQYLYKRFFVKK